ncbi:Ankyrin repeats (3 copies) [compost metagenome]
MVKILLEAGADPLEDFPAMHDAIEKGNLKVVELLAQYGSDVDSSLQSAVMFDQVAIVRLLLDYGADPNKGVTLAKTTYNADMLKLLEEAGATIDNRPRHETHPEDYKTEDGVRVRIR